MFYNWGPMLVKCHRTPATDTLTVSLNARRCAQARHSSVEDSSEGSASEAEVAESESHDDDSDDGAAGLFSHLSATEVLPPSATSVSGAARLMDRSFVDILHRFKRTSTQRV